VQPARPRAVPALFLAPFAHGLRAWVFAPGETVPLRRPSQPRRHIGRSQALTCGAGQGARFSHPTHARGERRPRRQPASGAWRPDPRAGVASPARLVIGRVIRSRPRSSLARQASRTGASSALDGGCGGSGRGANAGLPRTQPPVPGRQKLGRGCAGPSSPAGSPLSGRVATGDVLIVPVRQERMMRQLRLPGRADAFRQAWERMPV
jgi:hypothetical protein